MVATAHRTPVATTEQEVSALVTEAAQDGACLILTYVNSAGAVTARGVWPVLTQRHPDAPIWATAAGERCFSGFDSLRDTVISFRLDRVIDAHILNA